MAKKQRVWVADAPTEHALDGFELPWEVERIPVESIDTRESLRNNARLIDQLDSTLVTDYGQAMKDGAHFPRPVLVPKPRGGKYRVLSGNHRIAAAIAQKDKEIECYVLPKRCDAASLEAFTRTANRMVGKRQDREEAVMHAVELINRYSMSVEQIANMLQIAPGWLYNRVDSELCRQDLIENGVRAEGLMHSSLKHLAAMTLTKPKVEIAKLAVQYNLAAEEVRKLAVKAKAAKTERAALSELRAERDARSASAIDDAKSKKGAKVLKPVRTQFFRFLTGLTTFVTKGHRGKRYETAKQLQLTTKADRELARKHWNAVKEVLDGVFSE